MEEIAIETLSEAKGDIQGKNGENIDVLISNY